ncbi:hypothetical protein BDV93DRAFT_292133 [Ceratobasidium sp. AG-I]|nr:hypothetical protein BDV93DRAFT_292133 [Ceratobasidium sp. AG-I]
MRAKAGTTLLRRLVLSLSSVRRLVRLNMEWRAQDRWNCDCQGNVGREPESAQPKFLSNIVVIPSSAFHLATPSTLQHLGLPISLFVAIKFIESSIPTETRPEVIPRELEVRECDLEWQKPNSISLLPTHKLSNGRRRLLVRVAASTCTER